MDEICKSILTSSGDDDMPDPLEPRQLSPLSPNTETSLLEIMDRRQNALLQELDGLNERILALTTEFAALRKLVPGRT